jgi:hypothetical protein
MYVQYNFKIYILEKKKSLTFGIEERERKRRKKERKNTQ